MLNDLKRKDILRISETIQSYAKEIEEKIADMKSIDEKYRKLAEEEKKELSAQVAYLKSEHKFWTKSLSRYDEELVKSVCEEYKSTSTEEAKDEAPGTEPDTGNESVAESPVPAEESVVDPIPESVFEQNDTTLEPEQQEPAIETDSTSDWDLPAEETPVTEEEPKEKLVPVFEETSPVGVAEQTGSPVVSDSDWPDWDDIQKG